MNEQRQQIESTLHDIKSMMERSSRFISLSGWSGVAAGVCALVGAWFANREIQLFFMKIIRPMIWSGVSTFSGMDQQHCSINCS
jgi:hypothetical protein